MARRQRTLVFTFGGLEQLGRTVLSASSDALGGVLDSALCAMHVPIKTNPLGRHLLDVEQLALALAEAGLEGSSLRLALGFDYSAANRRAGPLPSRRRRRCRRRR